MEFNDYEITIQDGVLCTPDKEVNVPKGLGRFILESCDRYPNNIFQICPFSKESLTFAEFKNKSLNLAANLEHLCGVKPGDIIMTSMKNSLQNSLPIAAALYLNAVTCSLDPSLSVRDCEHLISLTEPKVIVIDADVVSNMQLTLKNINYETKIIINYANNCQQANGGINLQDLLITNDRTRRFQPQVADQNSMAAILFSSGTTGMPKGICLNHRSVFYAGASMHTFMDWPAIFCFCTTFYWISGLAMFIGQFNKGATKIALRRFDIEEFCTVCIKYKVEGAFVATSYLSKLLQAKDLILQSNLTSIMAGGVMATKGQFALMQKTFPQININQAYGMTEFGGASCGFTANYRHLMRKFPESTGLPMEGFQIKIVDSVTGKIVGPKQTGEICCKSNLNMMGYYKNNRESPYDKNGFLKTGDLGHFDENKMLYISGRSKDMFKYQSWHIVPASLESIIKEHPAVDEAVVFGTPDEQDGFLPSAAIILHENMLNKNIKPSDIADFVAARVADRQKLRGGVYFLKDVPRTPTGKIQRDKVQAILLK